MIKFGHLADAHLKFSTWSSWPQVNSDADFALEKFTEHMSRCGVDYLIASGDVLDRRLLSSYELYLLQKIVSRFRVLFVQGTHDTAKPPILSTLTDTHHLTDTPLIFDDVMVLGIDYQPRREMFIQRVEDVCDTIETSDRPVILVTHNAYRHLLRFESAWKAEILDIPVNQNHPVMVLAGDIHKRHVYRSPIGAPGSLTVVSSGALYPQDWEQTLHRNMCDVVTVDASATTPFSIESFDLAVREYKEITPVDAEDLRSKLADISSSVPSGIQLPTAVRILSTGDNELNISPEDVPENLVVTTMLVGGSSSADTTVSPVDQAADLVSMEDLIQSSLSEDCAALLLELIRADRPGVAATQKLIENKVLIQK